MRRVKLAVALGTALAVVALGPPTLGAEPTPEPTGEPTATPEVRQPEVVDPGLPEPEVPGPVDADTLIDRAEAALEGELPVQEGQGGSDDEAVTGPSLALTELYAAYAGLTRLQRSQANVLLARPDDGDDRDPVKYPAGADVQRLCGTNVCVQYITTGDHAPASVAWVQTTLDQLEAVWAREVGSLGFRAPATDGTRGGDGRLDVYLANVSSVGYYGYCAPETNVAGQRYRASGYCVLDDDYTGFAISPLDALRVTAAHEFFHAVQFNYDFAEDPWVMEATAAWMEEQYADDVDDNRNYLPYSQLRRPTVPLDKGVGLAVYGGWPFFTRLSEAYGVDAMRQIWARLDASTGAPDAYSIQAVARFLKAHRSSLGRFYLSFASGNVVPDRAYSEGAAYAPAPRSRRFVVTNARRKVSGRITLAHLSHGHIRFLPAVGLRRTNRLLVRVDGPPGITSPRARLRVQFANGGTRARDIRLNRAGDGIRGIAFKRRQVSRVTLTLANASARYLCWQGTSLSCSGRPLDNRSLFRFTATARR